MESNNLTYTKLLETNNLIRSAGEETYFLGVTRTVQESKFKFHMNYWQMRHYLMELIFLKQEIHTGI